MGVYLLFAVDCSQVEENEFRFTETEGYETTVRLQTTQGDLRIRFYPEKAPAHVNNFINLCGTGFYDGTYFHRVAPGFLIQGGDPNTRDGDLSNDGLGGYTYAGPNTSLRMESQETELFRGAIAMARTDEMDSAGSQFFIMLARSARLEEQYTVLGEVIDGIEVADRIAEEPGEPVQELGGFNPAKHQYLERCILEEIPREQMGIETGSESPKE